VWYLDNSYDTKIWKFDEIKYKKETQVKKSKVFSTAEIIFQSILLDNLVILINLIDIDKDRHLYKSINFPFCFSFVYLLEMIYENIARTSVKERH
jgi:hypothetical protein